MEMIEFENEESRPLPAADSVHVWRIDTGRPPPASIDPFDDLSDDERERAARLLGGAHDRFMRRRCAVRRILGGYLNRSPRDIALRTGPLGKPLVRGAEDRVHFSISQSDDVALVAVASVRVGVDVEHVRPTRRLARTVRRVLHPDTAQRILDLPPDRRESAFFDAWTQREAHVKAIGGGLYRTPDTLPWAPGVPYDASVHLLSDTDTGGQWSLVRFLAGDAARAALVAEGALMHLTFIDWEGTT